MTPARATLVLPSLLLLALSSTARAQMGIPSTPELRGQLDTVGYAAKPVVMAKVWELSSTPPAPASLGPAPSPGVAGVIGPHDDWVYAARVDRVIFPLVTARTVIFIGAFHKYRKLGVRDRLVFDGHRAWRSPDGEIEVSPLRDELLAALPKDEASRDDTAHDAEHSIEAIAYFLAHAHPGVEIVPILVAGMSLDRLEAIATHLGAALAASLKKHGWQLGRDVAVVISTDGTHYGADFQHTPFGLGGVDAFAKAVARDRAIIADLAGPDGARKFFADVVDPAHPDDYRVPWCGRFSVPFGLLLLEDVTRRLRLALVAAPVALGVSVDTPQLAVDGIGPTAPANLYHFVTHPAIAFTTSPRSSSSPRGK